MNISTHFYRNVSYRNVGQIAKHQGFTLIELLVVIGIMAAMATIALDNMTHNVDQQRFDQTVYKMKNIRRAILGEEVTANGEPVLSGFVADVGRLPDCLAELLEREQDSDKCDPNLDGDNDPTTEPHINAAAYARDVDSGLSSGWRGPYIHVFSDIKGRQSYKDGWGNTDVTDDGNFGWIYAVRKTDLANKLADEIELRSKGLNNVADGFDITATRADTPPGQGEYNQDVPTETLSRYEKPYPTHYYGNKALLVSHHDFKISVPDVDVYLENAPQCWQCSDTTSTNYSACVFEKSESWKSLPDITNETECVDANSKWQPTDTLCLKIETTINGSTELIDSKPSEVNKWNGSKTVSFTYGDDVYLTKGRQRYGVYYVNTHAPEPSCSDDLVFNHQPKPFLTIPKSTFPSLLNWSYR